MSHLTSSSVFATVMHLYCIFGSSSCVLFRMFIIPEHCPKSFNSIAG